MYFCVHEFEVGVNDSIFSGNEQQKTYLFICLFVCWFVYLFKKNSLIIHEENIKDFGS